MTRLLRIAAAFLALAQLAPRAAPVSAQAESGCIVLRSVTVIDVEAADAVAARRPDSSVVLAGDEIRALGPAASVTVPHGATVLDCAGKFLVPGLFDMHVHLAGQGDGVLAALVAAGVTSARDMGGDIALLDEARGRIERGELVGPRTWRAGFVVEEAGWLERVLAGLGRTQAEEAAYLSRTRIGIRTEDDVLEAVARISESGADVLKFRNTPAPAVFRALVREAKLAGLRVAGHEPNSIDLLEAVNLGIGSLEHLPVRALLVGTNEQRWQEIIAAMVRNGVHVTPTLVTRKSRSKTVEEFERALREEKDAPRWRTLPTELASSWEQELDLRRLESGETDWKDLFDRGEAVARAMHAAGVPFLSGTDLGVPFVYPGSGLHDELVALVQRVGLSPLEALRAATSRAAAWLGEPRLGTVRARQRADLVLLEADPLLDIENIRRIHTVFARGVRHGPEERARLAAGVAR